MHCTILKLYGIFLFQLNGMHHPIEMKLADSEKSNDWKVLKKTSSCHWGLQHWCVRAVLSQEQILGLCLLSSQPCSQCRFPFPLHSITNTAFTTRSSKICHCFVVRPSLVCFIPSFIDDSLITFCVLGMLPMEWYCSNKFIKKEDCKSLCV